MKLLLSTISLLAIGKECLSFSPNSIARPSFKPSTKKTTTTTLQAKSYTEDDASYVMEQAQECLDSESCPIDMANMYLHEVIYIQGSCAGGVLAGGTVCENVDYAAGIIGGLRSKIAQTEVSAATKNNGAFFNPSLKRDNLIPLYAGLTALCVSLTMMTSSGLPEGNVGVLPFTAQEWLYATRDGYVGNMLAAYLQHGGFVTDVSSYSSGEGILVLPFSAKEWMFAARDGYMGDMLTAYLRDGGLVVDASSMDLADVPLTPTAQEWWWATRDGYLGEMVSSYLRNGGI